MLTQLFSPSRKIPIFVQNELMIKSVVAVEGSRLMETITGMVEKCCPNLEVVARVDRVKTGVGAVNEHHPDLLILDTQLRDGSGFDLVRHFDKPDFKTIFISRSIDYAIKAIKFNAVDYLIKPLDEEEFALAVNKAAEMIKFEENLYQKALGKSIADLNTQRRLVLKTADQVHVVNIADIIRVEASSNYSTFFMEDGKRIVVSKAIKEYEETLLEHGFHRIHRSHIFNMQKMSHLDKADGGFVVMCDGSRVPVASRKREMLFSLFEEIK